MAGKKNLDIKQVSEYKQEKMRAIFSRIRKYNEERAQGNYVYIIRCDKYYKIGITFDIEKRFHPNTNVSLKGRQDFVGKIDRLEEGKVIVKILGETYSVPPQEFDSLFHMHEPDSPENWYSKLKYEMNML